MYSEARTKSNAFSLVILSRLEYPQSKKIRNISGLMHPEIKKVYANAMYDEKNSFCPPAPSHILQTKIETTIASYCGFVIA